MQFLKVAVLYSSCLFHLIGSTSSQEPEASIKFFTFNIDNDPNGAGTGAGDNNQIIPLKYTDDPDLWADFSNFDVDILSSKLCVTGV